MKPLDLEADMTRGLPPLAPPSPADAGIQLGNADLTTEHPTAMLQRTLPPTPWRINTEWPSGGTHVLDANGQCIAFFPQHKSGNDHRGLALFFIQTHEMASIVETFDAYMGHAGEDAEQDSLNPVKALRWRAQQVLRLATERQ